MKRFVFVISIFLFSENIFGNTDSTLFLNEYCFSINKTASFITETKAKIGFGVGVYHLSRQDKIINFKIGLEFNQTRRSGEEYFAEYTKEVPYVLNNFSLPLAVRINIGKKTKIFFEPGIFLNYLISSRPKELNLTRKNNNSGFNIAALVDAYNKSRFEGGFALGIGIRIPIEKKEIIIKYEFNGGMKLHDFGNENFPNVYKSLIFGIRI